MLPDFLNRRFVPFAILGVVALGVFLRIWYYAVGFSFFFNECALVVNLQGRTYAALSQTLDYDQAGPLGFLYLMKALTESLGSNEYMFRLLPLMAGLATIAAFYVLTRQILSGWALVAANLLLCVNQTAISHSAQAKQYSLELLAAVLMMLLSRSLFEPDRRPRVFWLSALGLGLLPWISFTAVFVLAGIGLALLLDRYWTPRPHGTQTVAGVFLLWLALFVPFYLISMRPGMANSVLHGMWIEHYFPLHALSKGPQWIITKIQEVGTLSFSQRLSVLAVICMISGLIAAILRRNLLILAGTGGAVACLAAAILQKYPFYNRMILFAVPAFILLIVTGYQWMRSLFPRGLGVTADWVAAAALLWCLGSAVKQFGVQPTFQDQPREALQFLRGNWHSGDRLYATPYSSPCVMYYGRALGLPSSAFVLNLVAPNPAQRNPPVLSQPVLPGRDWLVEMRTDWEERGESVPVREYFEARAQPLASKDMQWTSVTLYRVP